MEKVINWLTQEKEAIVEFQKASWAEGKQQLAQNAQQINEFVEKIASYLN